MASDVMSVRLWLPRIKVGGVVVDAPEELVVRVCSTVRRPDARLRGPEREVHAAVTTRSATWRCRGGR